MDTLQNIGQILLIVLGLAVVAATVVAYFRVSLTQTQVKKLREDLQDADNREARRDREIEDLKTVNRQHEIEKKALNQKITDMQRLIDNLQKLVQGTEQLNIIQRELANHDNRVDGYHATLNHQIDKILDNQQDLLQKIGGAK
jgi:chromosome segregation ATPase